jgi:Ran GTPase-activating protein 1
LQVVKMTQNGIRSEGITLLLDHGLRHASELRVLDLQDNTFTVMGSRMLANAVLGWPSLRELGVGDCFLTGRGGLKVLQALGAGKNEMIEVLRLGFNEITAPGVKALLHAAQNSLPALKRVELNGNKFEEDDSSVADLRELLEERKEALGKEDDEDEAWGLDDLDELEDVDSEDEEEEEESEAESEVDKKAEKDVEIADVAEDAKVAQKEDKDVDELAKQLEATTV